MSTTQIQTLLSNPDTLYALVGRKVRYLNNEYVICDLLAEEDMLILASDNDKSVQDDSFGRAHRMVPKQQSLKFRDTDGKPSSIWDDLIFLDGAL